MTPPLLPLALLPVFFESPRGLEFIGLLFCLWMIADCVKRERQMLEKILWLLFIIFVPIIGPLVYFFIRVVKIRT